MQNKVQYIGTEAHLIIRFVYLKLHYEVAYMFL